MIIRANAELLKMRNIEQAGEVREKGAHATVECALLIAVKENLVSVKAKLFGSCMESANSR